MVPVPRKAWVTTLTSTSFLPGTLVLHYSLLSVASRYPLVVMLMSGLPPEVHQILARRGISVRIVDPLTVERPNPKRETRFANTWTKLRAFNLVEFERIVLLDSDMVVKKNMDELMDLPLKSGWIAAVHVCACNPRKISHYPPDWIPENCAHSLGRQPVQPSASSPKPYLELNSGTVVLEPSTHDSDIIRRFLSTSSLVDTFRFPDQELLSHVFRGRWLALAWKYNGLKTFQTVHPNVWKDEEVKCVHYIFEDKPWRVLPGSAKDRDHAVTNRWWWETYRSLGCEMLSGDAEGRRDWRMIDTYVAHV